MDETTNWHLRGKRDRIDTRRVAGDDRKCAWIGLKLLDSLSYALLQGLHLIL